MADDRLRELERTFRRTGAVTDEAAWLRARVQAGELTEGRLHLLAHLGHPAATALVPPGPNPLEVEGLDSGPGTMAAFVAFGRWFDALAAIDRPAILAASVVLGRMLLSSSGPVVHGVNMQGVIDRLLGALTARTETFDQLLKDLDGPLGEMLDAPLDASPAHGLAWLGGGYAGWGGGPSDGCAQAADTYLWRTSESGASGHVVRDVVAQVGARMIPLLLERAT